MKPATLAALTSKLADLKTNDNTKETLERTIAHLKENGVNLEKTPLTVGPVLTIDPKTETFPGNAAANKLLTREYRKPYVIPAEADI